MKKEIVYLVGLPCSGKSTYIQENYKDYAVISNDTLVEEFSKKHGVGYDKAWKSLNFEDVKKECLNRFEKAVQEGKSILIDNTNLTVKSRSLYQAAGYERNAVIFKIDEKERLRRTEKRAKETGKRIPEESIQKMKACFVMPTAAEGFVHIVTVQDKAAQAISPLALNICRGKSGR